MLTYLPYLTTHQPTILSFLKTQIFFQTSSSERNISHHIISHAPEKEKKISTLQPHHSPPRKEIILGSEVFFLNPTIEHR
jgi:hypothetical protein